MRRLFLSGLVVNVLVMAINLATGILSARYLGPEGRGVLAIVVRWSGLFSMLFTIGLPGAVIYLGKQFPERQRELFGSYLLLGTSVGLLGAALGIFLVPQLLSSQPAWVVLLAQAAMIGVPFGVMADGFVGTLQTRNEFRKVMLVRLYSPLGTMAIILVLLGIGSFSVSVFIAASLVWAAVGFFIPAYWVLRQLVPSFKNALSTMKELLAKGLQMYAGSLVSTFGVHLDQLVMSFFLTTYTLGLYAVSASIGSIIPSVIVGAIGIYLFPKLMDMPKETRVTQVASTHSSLFYGTALLSGIGIVLLPAALPLVYGAEYGAAVLMGQLMLAAAPLQVAYVVLTNFISTEGKFLYATYSEATGLAAGVVVMLLLMPSLGGISAAIGVVVTTAVKWVFLALRCARLGLRLHLLFMPNPEIPELLRRGLQQRLVRGKLRKSGADG